MTKHNDPDMRLTRREWMKLATAGAVGASLSGWMETLATAAAKSPQRKRSCILLWMNGGPSQMDTFDVKTKHDNGGPVEEIATNVPGIRISEFFPSVSKHADQMAIVRSMSTKEADHGRATFHLRTGYAPTGPIQYPSIGSLISKELGSEDSALPNFVSLVPYRNFNPGAFGPGFLGPRHAPLLVGDGAQLVRQNDDNYEADLKVQDIDLPEGLDAAHADSRLDLLRHMQQNFVARHPGVAAMSHLTAYERAVKLMKTDAAKAFDLQEEPEKLRDAYGRNLFGQGCLLARRLVERGVPFVEVSLARIPNQRIFGWDTHNNNYESVGQLCNVLDPAWGTLMQDLRSRGLLDDTLIVWMGEFGRTPKINARKGRDHWARSWSTVLAGGGINGGQVVGKTSDDGMDIADRPVSVPDFLATVCGALGIDPTKHNQSNIGRPIRIVDTGAKPIQEVLR